MLTDLRWNNVGLLGGRSLLEALQKNKTMVQLDVAGNNIPNDTLKALGNTSVHRESLMFDNMDSHILQNLCLSNPEQTTANNTDRRSMLNESCGRAQVLNKEIQTLKDEKSRQVT